MRYGAKTDKGNVRDLNEDYCNIISGYPGIPAVFIIADGMGGHNSGEIASKTAVDFIINSILESNGLLGENADISAVIGMLMQEANNAVYRKSLENYSNSGMGTTLIIAVVIGKIMFIGHVGDSRLYHITNGDMIQVTTDHSFIEELVKNGSLTRQEAEKHPNRNIITKALGCSDILEFDTYSCEMKENDCFVLCTDGLTNMLDESEIKRIVCSNAPEAACEELVKSANRHGGEDNITVIVIKND